MKLIRSIRYVLVILSAILGLLGLSSTFGACSDYNLNNGVDYCYDIGSTYYLPCNTADSNCSFSFDSYGNFYGDLNYIGTITQMYGDYYYNAFGWVDGTFRKLYSQGSKYYHYYLYTGGCYGDTSHISDYGARNYSCDHGSSSNSTWLSSDSFSDLSLWGNIDIILNSRADSWSQVCFVSESVNEVLCFSNWTPTEELSAPNISLPYNLNNIGSNFFGSSPFSSSGGGSSDTPSTPSYQDAVAINSKIYDIFIQQGYSDNLCYGGYSLDNILTTSTGFDLSDIRLGSGADIFELYNVYSGGYSFVNWYDTYYQYFNYARFSENYGTFNGKSKGLLGLMATKQAVNSSFDSASIQNFCRLVVNGLYDTPVQTPIGIINDSVADWQLSEVIGSVSYTPPSSGSNIDAIVQTLVEQGVIDGYTGVEDLSDFYTRYQDQLNQLRVKFGELGVLPGYITLGFFAILMLYFFKK